MLQRRSLRSIAAVLVAGMLAGCAGGGGATVPRTRGVTPAATPTPTAGPAAFPTATVSGTVKLPPGVNLAPGTLTVLNGLGSATVTANGAFSLRVFSDGPQLAIVADAKGSPVLMGFLSANATTLDAGSTAAALLFFGTASFALTSDLRDQALSLMPSAPEIGPLSSAIGAALAANPDGFATTNGAVSNALQTAVASLIQTGASPGTAPATRLRAILAHTPAALRRPEAVLINPLQPASGLTPLSDFPDGVHFENSLRRPADLYVDRVSYVDAQGVTQPSPLSLTPNEPLRIPPTTGVTTTVQTLVNIVSGKYAYAPVESPDTALPLVPSSQSTLYQLTTVGPGYKDGALDQLSAAQRQDQEDLSVEFLLRDMALPLLLEFAIPGHDIDHALGAQGLSEPLIHDLVHAAEAVPGVAAAAQNGQWAQALVLVLEQIKNSQSVLANALQQILNAVLENEGITAQQAAFKVANAFLSAVMATDKILAAFDASVTEAGLVSADQADIWTVTVTADKVTLTPRSATLPHGTTQTFTANVPAESGSGATLVWHWANTAHVGHIADGLAGHLDDFDSSKNVVTYTANASGAGTDTITVTAFLVQGQNRIQLGTQTATADVTSGLVPQTIGPVSVPVGQGDPVDDGYIASFLAPPNGPISKTNPDADLEVDFQPHVAIEKPLLVATLYVARNGGPQVSGTPLTAVTFEVTGSAAAFASTVQATIAYDFYVQQPDQVPANHQFTCSFFQGSHLIGTGLIGADVGPGIAPAGAKFSCPAGLVGTQNQPDGTFVNRGFQLNTPYTLVIAQ